MTTRKWEGWYLWAFAVRVLIGPTQRHGLLAAGTDPSKIRLPAGAQRLDKCKPFATPAVRHCQRTTKEESVNQSS